MEGIWSLCSIFLICPIFICHGTQCNWKLDVIQSSSLTTEAILVDDGTLTDTSSDLDSLGTISMTATLRSQGGPRSYPYMLRISPNCIDQVSGKIRASLTYIEISVDEARKFAFNGGTPIVHVLGSNQITNSEKFDGATVKMYEGALINQEQLLGTSSYEIQTLAWVTPLELNHQSSVLEIKIETQGVTAVLPFLENHRLALSGFVQNVGTRPPLLGTTVANAVSGAINPPFHITAIPHVSPSLAMVTVQSSSTPLYILSEDVFATYTALQSPAIDTSLTTQCTCSGALLPAKELDIISLPDRLLFITKKGVSEVLGNMIDRDGNRPVTFSSELIHDGCARKVEPSQQFKSQQQWGLIILGGCSDYNKIFFAPYVPRNGSDIHVSEVLDNDGLRICDVTGYTSNDCSVVAAVSLALSTTKILVLVHHAVSEKYSLWEISDGVWIHQSTMPASLPSTITTSLYLVNTDPPVSGVNFGITGLTVSQEASMDLVLWGSRLLFSQDAGAHIYLIQDFDGASNIVQLASSPNNWYAILTDTQEVWVGMFGSESLKKVFPSAAWDVIHFDDSSPAPGSSFTVVSLIYDINDQLYMLLVKDGESDITRLNTKVAEILSHIAATEQFSSGPANNIFNEVLTVASPLDPCPFHEMLFLLPNLSWQKKQQRILYRKTVLYDASGSHTQSSLLLYQAAVYSINAVRDNFHETKYLRPYRDYLKMWQQQSSENMGYYTYLFENDLSPAKVMIDTTHFSIENNDSVVYPVWSYSLPRLIFLSHKDVANFTVLIHMADGEALRFPGEEESIQLGTHISNTTLLSVSTERVYLPLNNTVQFTVEIKELGKMSLQKRPGIGLSSASITLSLAGTHLNCFKEVDSISNHVVHQMTVLLGCPHTQRMVFDSLQTKNNTVASGDQTFDCHYADPDLPCFYFYNAFYPVFLVVDSATGEKRQWFGNYTLKIIGGADDRLEDIALYSEKDIFRYNSLTTGEAALIMSPVSNSFTNAEGWVIYNGLSNGISWFCQAESPCSLILPKFPKNAEYYFLMEFSNKDVDNGSNCDYTMQFVVHLHGLPINSIALSASLVLVAVMFICIWFGLFYYYELHKKEIKDKLIDLWIRIWYPAEEEDDLEVGQLTNEELEELASKDWKRALQIKVEKMKGIEEDEVEHEAVTVGPSTSPMGGSLASVSKSPHVSTRRLRGVQKERRPSVGIGATLDGRVSIMAGDIDASEIMRLRALNRIYHHRSGEEDET